MSPGEAMSDAWRPAATLEVLRLRAQLLRRAREYFDATATLEVETPALVRTAVTDVHLDALEVRQPDGSRLGHLHTSPEYAMKRLLSAGAPDIYQVAHVFRAGERGRNHNPEFTMIEWYRLGIDHHALMDDVEGLVRALLGGHVAPRETRRVTYAGAVAERLGVDALEDGCVQLVRALEVERCSVPESIYGDRDALLDLAMATVVAPAFPTDRITFVYDFPATQAALARAHGPVASRFEAFWGGLELANGFHELGDAREQARRFERDRAQRRERGLTGREADTLFLAALESGLPDCSGVALGFDRVVMIAAGASRIDEVLAFPIERA
jgi:lysyl-tRNA synthetase class 2